MIDQVNKKSPESCQSFESSRISTSPGFRMAHIFPLLLKGGIGYYLWLSVLGIAIAAGTVAYIFQVRYGLIITGMRDPFPWGIYIGNFTFLVGIAAAAILVMIPSYLYHYQPLKEVCIIGELLAASSIIMCLLFIVLDLGRPDRFWHIIPLIGQLHFPQSMMAWDCLVLWGYLLLNLIIPWYILTCKYQGRQPNSRILMPLVYLSVGWAISIHTVTAFIYSSLSAVPSWYQAVMTPRFLASAFTTGPAILILILQIIGRYTKWPVEKKALFKLSEIMTIALFFNLFMFGAEIFLESYAKSSHFVHRQYLLFGLHGHTACVIPTWISIALQVGCLTFLLFPGFRYNPDLLNLFCGGIFAGVWFDKGIGLIAAGFIPSSIGEIFEYHPTLPEIIITLGIWAIGLFIFTLLARLAILIEAGDIRGVRQNQSEKPGQKPDVKSGGKSDGEPDVQPKAQEALRSRKVK
ncbi:MAG: sulfate reduction electron transfer complex DsrMKJOP subunit DsrP [bacterium]